MSETIGCLLIDLTGQTLTPEERELLAHPLVGGIILFARNYESPEQIQSVCTAVHSARKKPLLITVDQEGGRVQRFIKHFTKLPPMAIFGKLYAEDPAHACEQARECGWLLATELLAVNVDLSFAPVLDLNNPISSLIGNRAFAADPQVVIRLASAFMQGLHEAGMAAVGKHFPGHGSIAPDSHVTLPTDDRAFESIAQHDMQPFAALIKAGIPALMSSHIIFPEVDNTIVTFSRIWLQNILRKQLGFTGSIFSDDLGMEGAKISANYSDRVIAAREAGCDFTLLCNNRHAVINVLDEVPSDAHQLPQNKWQPLQGKFDQRQKAFKENSRWQRINDYISTLIQQTA